MCCLIYESGESGHRHEYVSHLMKFIISNPELHGTYTFYLNEKIQKKIGSLDQEKVYDVKYFQFCDSYSNSIERSFAEWKTVSKSLGEEKKFSEIIFLDIDPYLILLTTDQFKQYNLSVRGILFEPYMHFRERKGNVWFYMRHVLRSYVFQRFSTYLNPNIHKLFILNDKKCITGMNKHIKDIFCFLPDPIDNEIQNVAPENVERIVLKYGIRPDKKNLLLFGSIDNRKNLTKILNSLILLPKAIRDHVHLIIAGKFLQEMKETYVSQIEKCIGEVSIVYYDEFVADEEREVLFQYCDLVLMPYINFYSSSGILGHTIKHNKNVIASNSGLVGRIVNDNKIGITVNPLKEKEIKDAILDVLNRKTDYHYKGDTLLKEYEPNNFSKTLLLA